MGEYNPLISIIIPVYNIERYIARCLDSVLNQSYGNLQVIVIDDGSTDNSGAILDEYAKGDSRIDLLHKENAGVATARNTALSMVKGEYVAFADGDDYLEKDIILKLFNAIIKENADLSCCGYYEEYEDRTINFSRPEICFDKHEAYMDFFTMGGRIGSGCWNKLFRTEALKDIQYKKYVMGEDVEMLTRALDNCNRVICIEYMGYHYVHRSDSATRKAFRPDNLNILNVTDDMIEYISPKYPELMDKLYSFKASWQVAALQILFLSGGKKKNKKEELILRESVKKNISHYRGNPCMYKIDRILLESYLLNLFVPAKKMIDIARFIVKRIKNECKISN